MNEEKIINVKAISKALIFSVTMTVLCIFVLALICYFSNISDKSVSAIVFVISIICVLLSAIAVSKNAKKGGFIHGGLVGVSYFLVLIILSILINKSLIFSMHMLSLGLGSIGAGVLGGILGINTNR